mmetsp:Transcript_36330/g.104603  ORF Transcript_36330/g.104603 Transcript_36330/m.104603 type:complete len:230 (-) Transcript_36330:529-1218(-)
MTVCLEVDADVQLQSRMVAMLNSGLCADHVLLTKGLHRARGGATVGVGRLHKAEVKPGYARLFQQPRNEVRHQESNAIAVQQVESGPPASKVVENAVGIPVEAQASDLARVDAARLTLLHLDEVSAASLVQLTLAGVCEVDFQPDGPQAAQQRPHRHGPDAVRAVEDRARAVLRQGLPFRGLDELRERLQHLLPIARQARCAVGPGGSLAAHDVMQLGRRCHAEGPRRR